MTYRISRSAMDPAHWGRTYWDFMFVLASTYPYVTPGQNDVTITDFEFGKIRRRTMCLIQFIARSIPCSTCRLHFKMYMKKYPLRDNMDTREHLVRWLWTAKSEVNKRSKKRNTPFDTVCKFYNCQADSHK